MNYTIEKGTRSQFIKSKEMQQIKDCIYLFLSGLFVGGILVYAFYFN